MFEFFKKLFRKKQKYNVKPKNNQPREVYGVPDFKNYDIDPEDNQPREVYGVPDFNNYQSTQEKNNKNEG